jgi:hypothetical protein
MHSDILRNGSSAAFGSVQLSANTALKGTVGATVRNFDQRAYISAPAALLHQMPLGPARPRDSGPGPRVHARDLIAELDSINTQIQRMMFQVERAVARLAMSG